MKPFLSTMLASGLGSAIGTAIVLIAAGLYLYAATGV